MGQIYYSPLKTIKEPSNAPEWGYFMVNKYEQILDKYDMLR